MCSKFISDAISNYKSSINYKICGLQLSKYSSNFQRLPQLFIIDILDQQKEFDTFLLSVKKLTCSKQTNLDSNFVKDDDNIFTSTSLLKKCLSIYPSDVLYNNLINCKVKQKYPSKSVLHMLAQYFSLRRHSDGLATVKSICSITDSKEYLRCARFSHYSAQLMWMSGNIRESMQAFNKAHNENNEIKDEINSMIGKLILATMPDLAKASVITISELATNYSIQNDEFSVLGALWYALFISKWYEDQVSSLKLLQMHPKLQIYVETQIPIISKRLLLNHNVCDFQRLLDSALQCNMDNTIGQLLRALFDYYCNYSFFDKMGYTRGCRAVMKCSTDIDVPLTADQTFKYETLIGAVEQREKQILPINIINKVDLNYKF